MTQDALDLSSTLGDKHKGLTENNRIYLEKYPEVPRISERSRFNFFCAKHKDSTVQKFENELTANSRNKAASYLLTEQLRVRNGFYLFILIST